MKEKIQALLAMAEFTRRGLNKVPRSVTLPSKGSEFVPAWQGDDLHTCFACSPDNRQGLKLKFFETAGRGVIGSWRQRRGLDSFPGIIHGGIVGTILDESGGYAIFERLGHFAVTVESQLRYRQAVRYGKGMCSYTRVAKQMGRFILVDGWICDESGRVAVAMNGLYYMPDRRQFEKITQIRDFSPAIASYICP